MELVSVRDVVVKLVHGMGVLFLIQSMSVISQDFWDGVNIIHPVKISHKIIDLAGSIDWHVQKGHDKEAIKDIKEIRNKLSQLQKFLRDNEPY